MQDSTGLSGTATLPSTSTMDSRVMFVAYLTIPCSAASQTSAQRCMPVHRWVSHKLSMYA